MKEVIIYWSSFNIYYLFHQIKNVDSWNLGESNNRIDKNSGPCFEYKILKIIEILFQIVFYKAQPTACSSDR